MQSSKMENKVILEGVKLLNSDMSENVKNYIDLEDDK